LLKIGAWTLAALVVLAAIAITLTIGWRPILGPKVRPVTQRKFQPTPERLQRGRYLAENVMGCIECHTPSNDAQPVPERTGPPGSGKVFVEQGNFRVVAPNLTSDPETGLGNWTDDQIARAIREGVDNKGRALFPIMPYQEFRSVSDEDIASVVVYVRTLPAVHHVLPPTSVPFPLSRLINMAPEPVTAPVPQPDMSNPVKRGEYLVHAGGCIGCHTPNDRGRPLPNMEFAGGQVFGDVASANLTPDPSGISYYDPQLFREVMRTGKVKARQLKLMPWWVFRNMTDEDLNAIFAYLRTVPPRKHRVDNTEPPTFCRLCRHKHGGGQLN
jgi:mono/diheme cytochrome c family protein